MKISVISYVPYLNDLKNEYILDNKTSVEEFINSLGIKWDDDVLIVVNKVIITDKYINLKDGDIIELLIPLSGG
ncbi:hypothetical protein BKP35_16800 [Anaerobacillus arseniciselenatis]|uniref:Molybdopterin synthase sulfur carrier subunit n=1 Tax=Anaerobacillus arseniciselenatis TaxID=85682 RepID=A0A1S2LAQ0_9BACI|nr:MoaD/ThiS family protein [Anaerobacillus arseniciselenatis]OIJ09330.1 hypothetical protein BKP35_16800 [Anaerobacillus arseniciselenatis]